MTSPAEPVHAMKDRLSPEEVHRRIQRARLDVHSYKAVPPDTRPAMYFAEALVELVTIVDEIYASHAKCRDHFMANLDAEPPPPLPEFILARIDAAERALRSAVEGSLVAR